jgi:nucleoid DNA-binding protein
MENSINALLNTNLRVIIPDFGAFIIRQKKPRIVVFNEFLRYNDGLLIGYVARNEGIDPDIAGHLVNEYTGNIMKVLESGKPFNFKGIGSLQKDSNGKIVFISEQQAAEPDAAKEQEDGSTFTLSVDEPPVKSGTKPAGKSASIRRKKGATAPAVPEPGPLPEAEPAAPEPPMEEEAVVAENNPIPEEFPAQPPTVTIPVQASLPKQEEFRQPEPFVKDIDGVGSTPDQKQLIIRWIALIILANAAIVAWFVFGDNIRGLFSSRETPAGIMDSVYQNLSDSVRAAAADTTLIFRDTEEIPTFEKNPVPEETVRYYIVAGCFRDEINADELVKSLKEQGFDAEKFGRIGNLFAVSFASFVDKEMAVKELKRIREEIHPEAWMTQF